MVKKMHMTVHFFGGAMFKSQVFSLICISSLLAMSGTLGHAADIDDAQAVAINILKKIEQKQNSTVWETHVSKWFKGQIGEEAFLANLTLIQSQLGGEASERKIVQRNKADGNPQTGYKGAVYGFIFSSKFPGVNAYENIYLIREDSAYRLSGINYVPKK